MQNLDSLAREMAGRLPNFLAAGVVVFLFGAGLSYWFRRESPARRFAIWFSGLVAMAGIPLLAIAWSFIGTSPQALAKTSASIILPGAWARYLFLGWMAITAIALVRVALGLRHVYVLRHHSRLVNLEHLAPELQAILLRFQAIRPVTILASDRIESPTALGLFGPAVAVPEWILKELTTSELEQVLLHELAHLRRYDDWSNLAQKIVKAVFFFHPAVWWMESKLSLEREMACDEAVLEETGNPRAYAQCLAMLAEKSFMRRSVMLAQAVVSRIGLTSRRVARILRSERSRSRGTWKIAVPSFATVLVLSVASASRMPELVAFENSAPEFAPRATSTGPKAASWAPIERSQPKLTAGKSDGTSGGNHKRRLKPDDVRVAQSGRPPIFPYKAQPKSNVVQAKLDDRDPDSGVNRKGTAASEVVIVFLRTTRQNGVATEAFWQVQLWRITVLQTSQNLTRQKASQKVI